MGAACLVSGCGPLGCGHQPLDVGSNVVWSTDFETGDFSAWSAPPGTGGSYIEGMGSGNATVTVTTEQAHSGRYSAKLASAPASQGLTAYALGGSGLYKEGAFPEAAYYSVWYFVPQFYPDVTTWSILKLNFGLGTPATVDASADAAPTNVPESDASGELLELGLMSLPDQTMTIKLVDARHEYLTSPLPDPVPAIPIGQWFQIESYYEYAADSAGRLTVWLQGTKIYDIQRPMSGNPIVYFTPCSLVDNLPSPSVLYVDDVTISWVRVTPEGLTQGVF
jgi:hypothetical protein